MILNDIESDVLRKIKRDRRPIKDIILNTDISRSYFSHAIKRSDSMHISKGTVKILEALGYDIRLRYIKRAVDE